MNNFSIIKCTFNSCTVKSQLIDATNIILHSMKDTQCLMNNYNNIMGNLQYLGGCFRSVNVNIRHYSNVTIAFCYSDFTTVGIKIIDSESNADTLKTVTYIKKKIFCKFYIHLILLNFILNFIINLKFIFLNFVLDRDHRLQFS